MKYRMLLSGLLFVWLLPPSVFGGEPRRIVPDGWSPDLSQAVDWSMSDLKDAKDQMTINALSRQIADMRDAGLFVIYIRLYQHLDAQGRQLLVRDQSYRLSAREKNSNQAVIDQGGSAAPAEANSAEAEFSEKRTKVLTKRLGAFEKHSVP